MTSLARGFRANWDGHIPHPQSESANFLGTTEVINNDPDTGKLLKVAFAPRRHKKMGRSLNFGFRDGENFRNFHMVISLFFNGTKI